MKRKEGLILVVSAPSGAGKTSLCRSIMESVENLDFSVSYTTRLPRPGEVDGRDYHFIPEDRFQRMIEEREFVEWARVHGNLYGTSGKLLSDLTARGTDVLLDIDTQGARQIREHRTEAVFVFIMPPSIEVLEERLRNRKSDADQEIRRRMGRAREEIRDYGLYDYIVINDDFNRAQLDLKSIIFAERCRIRLLDQNWINGML